MKGTGNKKLKLARETLRDIGTSRLAQVQGAWKETADVNAACAPTKGDTCASCYYSDCCGDYTVDTCATACDCLK